MNSIAPASAMTEKKPLRIRAAMKDLKEVAPAHQHAVANDIKRNQKSTARRPKYADKVTTNTAPTPSIKTLPAWEWLT